MYSNIYIYKSHNPYFSKTEFVYSRHKDHGLDYDTKFVVVEDKGMYSIYSIEGDSHQHLLNVNSRDLNLIIISSLALSPRIEEKHAGIVYKLKHHMNNMIDTVESKARDLFYKSKDATLFNRSLRRSSPKMYESVRDICSGRVPKIYRDEIEIASHTKPLNEFKVVIKDIQKSIHRKIKTLADYVRRYNEYEQIFRYVEANASSLSLRSLGSSYIGEYINNGFCIQGIQFFGRGISYSSNGQSINVITKDDINFDVYVLDGSKIKCVSRKE